MVSRVAFGNDESHPPEISISIGLDVVYPDPVTVQIIVNVNPLIGRKIIATDGNFLPGNSVVGGERDIWAIGLCGRSRQGNGYKADGENNQQSR
jgi:hypothetical protein